MASGKSTKWLAQMEAFFKACADQTRLRILNLLMEEGEISVGHLVAVLGTNQPKVSRHLAYLKRVGLITNRKEGLVIYYRLAVSLPVHAERLMTCLRSCVLEVPELQREVVYLQKARNGQGLMNVARTVPVTELTPIKSIDDWEARSEIQIELL